MEYLSDISLGFHIAKEKNLLLYADIWIPYFCSN